MITLIITFIVGAIAGYLFAKWQEYKFWNH
jgi:hypothetical protein